MGAADQEAGVPGLGELFDGLADVLPDAADDPVGEQVDGSDGRQTELLTIRNISLDHLKTRLEHQKTILEHQETSVEYRHGNPTHRMYPSMEAVHMMLSVMGAMHSTDSALRAKRSLVAPKPFQLKM